MHFAARILTGNLATNCQERTPERELQRERAHRSEQMLLTTICQPDYISYQIIMFKSYLDRFLKLLLDEPLIPGYIAMRRADSNSLLDLQVSIKNILFEVKDATIDQMMC